jgi:FkbM family methyltransferase
MVPLQIKRAVHQIFGVDNYFLATALYQVAQASDKSYQRFLHALPAGGRLLDIGANFGVTVAHARRIRPDIKITAFEPIPSNIATAQRLCRLLRVDNVEFHPVALGESNGMVEMVMPILSGLPAPRQTYVQNNDCDLSSVLGTEGIRFTVPVTNIDDLHLTRVDGMKVDVENFEWHVLRGAKELLKRDHPIIYCELWDTPNRCKVMELLRECGYSYEKADTKEDFLFWQS